MLKTLLRVLVAGTVGFVSIIGGYFVLAVQATGLSYGSDARFIAMTLMPIPIGLCIAWATYRGLESISTRHRS